LITFGAGFAAGSLTGIMLTGTGISETAFKMIASLSGGIAGLTVRTGSFLIIK
jgi:hypothetical protein